jgi:hypothetical protein
MPGENDVWFNINKIAELQKGMINDLSGNNQPEATRTINNIASNLAALDTTVSGSSVLPTLTYQNDVNRILEREKNRLDEKKQIVDNAEMSQKRLIDLTTNTTLRNKAINQIYVIITISLFIYLGIQLLSNFVPPFIADILVILLVSITIIMVVKMYSDYSGRNNMDYNIIDLGEPGQKTDSASSAKAAAASANLLDARFNGCVKEACCPKGSTFNEKYSICVPDFPPNDGKTTINYKYFISSKSWEDPGSSCEYSFTELACKKDAFTTIGITSDKAKPNSPDEFINYNLYK